MTVNFTVHNESERIGKNHAARLRKSARDRDITCFIGIYDVFSATVAAEHFDGLFISGFGFAASYYGLPDVDFIAWPDIVQFIHRIRTVLPQHHLMVDIDDGYTDVEVTCHVTKLLETVGASGVILDDQQQPRRCGKTDGNQIISLDHFLITIDRVLAKRNDLFVVARTGTTDPEDISRRAQAFERTGVDAVLIDSLTDLSLVRQIRGEVKCPLMFNQMAGGKSPTCGLSELADAGISLVNYNSPCLFAAQTAIEETMKSLKARDGNLAVLAGKQATLPSCQNVLFNNLKRRDAA